MPQKLESKFSQNDCNFTIEFNFKLKNLQHFKITRKYFDSIFVTYSTELALMISNFITLIGNTTICLKSWVLFKNQSNKDERSSGTLILINFVNT